MWVSSNTIVKGSLSCYCVSYKELFGDRMTYADLASCHTTPVALIPFSTALYVITYLTSLDTLLDVDFTCGCLRFVMLAHPSSSRLF